MENENPENKGEIKKGEKTIDVKGMHCKSCVDRIESEIGSLEGIENVKVNLIENKADIKFDSGKISLNKIKSEINSLGYECNCDAPMSKGTRKKTIMQGITYGLIPHIGCIAFIFGSILGVTLLMQFFKPLLMNRYFFHYLIGISLGFATLSSGLYLKKQGMLSKIGIKRKKGYLFGMYGSTIGINLVLFLLIFPFLANVGAAGDVISSGDFEGMPLMELSVDIPCPGHAPLISNEIKTIQGVRDVKFSFPNDFEVLFDDSVTNKEEILSLEVFDEYPATVTQEPLVQEVDSDSSGSTLNKVQPLVTSPQSNGGKAGTCGSPSCGSPTCTGGGSCGGGCGGGG